MFGEVNEAVQWMEQRRFITKGIDAFASYMKSIGNPQDDIPCIHIAGTNGKGSTLNYLSCVLQEAGYRVGTFSSPYMETHFDRICINQENIDPEIFLNIVHDHYQEWIDHEFNMFEIDFVIATLYFQMMHIDFAIYEVGLGGTTDATNVVSPILSIITNIGKDHMELLGDTYEKIAHAKAGIIKYQTPVITAEKKSECIAVFQMYCDQLESKMIQIQDVPCSYEQDTLTFAYQHVSFHLTRTPKYQSMNIACVLEAISYLKDQNIIQIQTEQLQAGIIKSHWKGRFEIMQEHPLVILDGAHNKEGIDALCNSMTSYSNIHIVFSALKDKDHDAMLESLLTISDDITVCEFGFYRGSTCENLAKQYHVNIIRDVYRAIDDALTKQGTILITGSLYFISEVRKYLIKKRR